MVYPFVSGYDPHYGSDPAWEAAVIPTLSDASDTTFIHFDSEDAVGHLNLVLRGDPAVFPEDSSTVTAVTFTIRARTLRADDDPYPVSMTFYLADPAFDGAMEFTNYVAAYDDNRMGMIVPNTPDWAEATVTLDEAGIQDGLGDGQTWAGYEATWTDLAGFVDHLRVKGGFEVWLERNFTGMWDLAGVELRFVTPSVEPVDLLMQGELLTVGGAAAASLMSVTPYAIDPELTNGPPTIAGADPGGVVVGANPLLDGSDATYARTAITDGTGQVAWICVPLKSIPDLTPANFNRLTVYVRVKGTASGGATYPLRFLVSFMTLDFDFISEFVDPAPISASFQVANSTTVDAVLNHTMLQGNSGTYADGVSDLIPKLVSGDCQIVFYVLTNFPDPDGGRYVGDLFELSVTTAHGVAEPVNLLMQGELLTMVGEGATLGALMSVSAMSAGVDLTESFEGGSNGAVITTANTIFEGVNGLDPVFTNEVAHGGTLSAKTSLAISVLDVPYGYDKVSDSNQASGSFWFQWTGDTGNEERGIFTLFTTASVGDLIMNDGIMAVEFVTNGTGDGWHFRYNHDGGTTVDVPITMSSYVNTWLHAIWAFDSGVLDFSIATAAGTPVFALSDTTVDGTAFGRSKYYLGEGGGFRNYLDDVVLTVGAAVETEPVSLLMQGPVLTVGGS